MDIGLLAQIFGPDGLIIVAVLGVVLIFGGRKLPELARGLGSASHEFKKGMAEGDAADQAKPASAEPPSTPLR